VIDGVGDLDVEGDVQTFNITNKRGLNVRLDNDYNQLQQMNNIQWATRPVRSANWKKIMEERNVKLCGD
jgi:hypothetical protein